ncbi:MAG: universal stress protein [Chitinophagaceae bacterium]|jgi:nucleotide-binding universal stress UspA family protein|nr:universal stress protein [Chitinophagaceae bacterium]
MNTILIPTDFSNTSKNAIQYAIALAQHFDIQKIILYHAWEYIPVSSDPLMETGESLTIGVLQKSIQENMDNFVKEINNLNNTAIEIQAVNEYTNLADGIKQTCADDTSIGLIIMGITGNDKQNYSVMDDGVASITQHLRLPIIMIPSQAKFSGIQNVVLACDFKHIDNSFPANTVNNFLQKLKAKVLVLNVSAGAEYNTQTDVHAGVDFLRNQLQAFSPEFHFIESSNISMGIHQFAEEKNAQFIIVLPKKHGWFESLFKKSHTQQLAHYSNIPLLTVPE